MSEDQLREIREILQVAVQLTQQSREDIVELNQAVRTNTTNINRLAEKLEQYLQQAQTDRELITSEVRGIRLEVQRVVEHLFGQDNQQ
jgi:hypothetical protein